MPKVPASTLRLQAKISELEEAMRSAEAALARKADIEEQLAHAVKNVAAFRDETSSLRTAVSDYKAMNKSLDSEIYNLRDENRCLRRDLDRCLGWIAKAMDLPPLGPSTGMEPDDKIPF